MMAIRIDRRRIVVGGNSVVGDNTNNGDNGTTATLTTATTLNTQHITHNT